MWPWGHLAVGYLALSIFSRYRFDRPPRAAGAIAVAVGTQFPDLIDKPLAWSLGVLPSGRSLAHSVLVTAVVVLAVDALGRRVDRRMAAAAFGLGYGSHLFADALAPLWSGTYADLAFLAWPIVPATASVSHGIIWYFLTMEWTPYAIAQFGLALLAGAVWVLDGAPGLALVRRALVRRSASVE